MKKALERTRNDETTCRPGEASQNAPMAFLAALSRLDDDTAAAIKERAACLEYDGGLPREDAERIALETATRAQDDPLSVLAGILERFPLIGMTDDGRPVAAWSNPETFIRNRDELAASMEGRGDARGAGKGQAIRRYGFIPGPGGLIALDIDRGHADGADGVSGLHSIYAGLPIPSDIAALDHGSFPVYTRTPKGGFHLFFRYSGSKKYGPQAIAPGVEVVHFRKLLTAPGSARPDGIYTLTGRLEDAPPFPGFLENLLKPDAESRPPVPPRPVFTTWEKDKGRPSLDLIAQWAIDDGGHAGRNDLAHGIARRAFRGAYTPPYSREEVKDFLRTHEQVRGLPEREIDSCVDSAFSYKGAT